MRDKHLSDLGEMIATAALARGHVTGLQRMEAEFRKLSGEAYAAGEDERSRFYREAAEEARKRAAREEEINEKCEYGAKEESAFRELERRDRVLDHCGLKIAEDGVEHWVRGALEETIGTQMYYPPSWYERGGANGGEG